MTGYVMDAKRWLAGIDIARLRQTLQRRLMRISREAALGLGLIVLCLVFYLAAVRPAQSHLDQLHADMRSLHEQIQNSARALQANRETPSEQLLAFYKFFPGASSSPVWLDKIYSAARRQHLTLDQGEYRPAQEKTGRLMRYQITLPVRGSYLQLRNFLAAVLTDVPIASLDHISFERRKIGDQAIDAKIKLTLYLTRE